MITLIALVALIAIAGICGLLHRHICRSLGATCSHR